MDKKILLLVLSISLLALGACTPTNMYSKWNCEGQGGEDCITIQQADEKYGLSKFVRSSSKARRGFVRGYNKESKEGLRSAEVVGSIWFYPYEDDSGNYHDGRNVHVVLEEAEWM